ncbi:MAG: hypothetical protein AAGB15_08170 [Pseudomonadota bacterium]
MTDKTTIRNLNPDLYTQARIAAIEHNCTVADIINDALEDWFGGVEDAVGDSGPACERMYVQSQTQSSEINH